MKKPTIVPLSRQEAEDWREALEDAFCEYEEPDEYEGDGSDECGMMPDGQCTLAGSEWCDWNCPNGGT